MSFLIDSHCHLASLERRGTLEEALSNAEKAGVRKMITIGTSVKDWAFNREIAAQSGGGIGYTVGLHPTDIGDDWEEQLECLPLYFSEGLRPLALGEIGLDHFHLPADPEKATAMKARQKVVFDRQLAIAARFHCPVVIHSRNAFHDCVRVIDRGGMDWAKVVFHCFADGPEEIRLLSERGGRGSFTGIITYKNAPEIRAAALAQGMDKVMVETDAPYLSPEPKRGKPNEPAYVRYTAEFCARLFNLEREAFIAKATANARAFFAF